MKRMITVKKIISIILCLTFIMLPLSVSAAEYPEETLIMMGDVNLDGKVSASDARLTLRISAKLDSDENVNMLSIDTDANGKITSSDARIILRKAASLAEFSYGFDGNGLANSIKALKNKKYSLTAMFDDMNLTMVVNNDDIHILTTALNDSSDAADMDDVGILICDGQLYMTFKSKGSDVAMFVPENLYSQFEIDVNSIYEVSNIISSLMPDDFGVPTKTEVNGETMYLYSLDDGYNTEIYVDAYGTVKSIGSSDSGVIDINSISADVSDNYFDMSRFVIM